MYGAKILFPLCARSKYSFIFLGMPGAVADFSDPFLSLLPSMAQGIVRGYPEISELVRNLISRQEPIFLRMDGMGFNLHNILVSQCEDTLEATRRF